MGRIIVSGSLNMDIVSKVKKLPQPGQAVVSENFKFIPGGKGANQAVAASRLGASVSFLGKIGNDAFGKKVSAFLKKEKLYLHSLKVSKSKPTGTVVIIIDRNGTNIMSWMSGSNDEISKEQIKNLTIRQGDIVISTFEIPQEITSALFKKARKSKATTILNASPLIPPATGIFALTDYLIINEHELAFFAKLKKSPGKSVQIIKAIIKLKTKAQVIVTLGKKGSVFLQNGKLIKVPGYNVKAADTTAAGDCFLGAFASVISKHQTLKQAIAFANAAAALSVQKVGASSSLPYLHEVKSFLKNN